MLDMRKDEYRPAGFAEPNDVTIGELLRFLGSYPDRCLVFHYADRDIRAGYHITEVKVGEFSALDCGANPEFWTEIFVQLWDVNEGDGLHMTAGKFSAIVRKVAEQIALPTETKLTFEVSDDIMPMQLFRASEPTIEGDEIRVYLAPRPASCKPRDRWLEQGTVGAKPCCAASAAA